MTQRHRLANRRQHEVIAIEHEGQRYKVGLGRELVCDESCGRSSKLGDIQIGCGHKCGGRTQLLGPIAEVFLNAQKVNSPLDVLASDGAILISMLLQYGCPPADIARSMKKNLDGSPASPLGRAAAFLIEGDQ